MGTRKKILSLLLMIVLLLPIGMGIHVEAPVDNCWSVVAEAIQTILRREAYPHPYEALKALTRTNQAITENSIKEFIEELNVNEDIKKELRAITPHTYTGL